MKTEQLNTTTKTTCASIGITSTLVRISAGLLAGAVVGYFVLKKKPVTLIKSKKNV